MNTLYVVATPIGNLEDITIRAIKVLLSIPLIACEDTRHTGQLLKTLKDRYPELDGHVEHSFLSVRDWNEAETIDRVLEKLLLTDVALVSDAGTPLISDPGFKVVRAARAKGFTVSPVPGPSASITALSASGLPTNKFLFLGFLPKKWDIQPETTTIIYESPERLGATLELLYEKYPTAQIVVAKELTKIHEEFIDGHSEQTSKGEATILVYIPKSEQSTELPTRGE